MTNGKVHCLLHSSILQVSRIVLFAPYLLRVLSKLVVMSLLVLSATSVTDLGMDCSDLRNCIEPLLFPVYVMNSTATVGKIDVEVIDSGVHVVECIHVEGLCSGSRGAALAEQHPSSQKSSCGDSTCPTTLPRVA